LRIACALLQAEWAGTLIVMTMIGRSTWLVAATIAAAAAVAAPPETTLDKAAREGLEQTFSKQVRPFLTTYCLGCHGDTRQEGKLNLGGYSSVAAVAENYRLWTLVLERLDSQEMPPEDAPLQPPQNERQAITDWVRQLHQFEAARNAGDPGPVLARRLSASEYDYTIRDLTGVDIRPAREFPIDPANEAGFDNSGQSLAMSPALLKKYLAAARSVADHVVLLPEGFRFASHPVVADTDRDKYCVLRIVDFYQRHEVALPDYFHAAWRFRHRARLGRGEATLADFAAEMRLSSRYLATIWELLGAAESDADDRDVGPLALVQAMWSALPPPDSGEEQVETQVRLGCRRIGDLVARLRGELRSKVNQLEAPRISKGSQPLVLWHNRQQAARRRQYSGGDVAADLQKLKQAAQNAAELKTAGVAADESAALLTLDPADEQAVGRARRSLERFCSVFPDTFCMVQRGPYFAPDSSDQQRLLTAGFHLMQGYFRDDAPLCELVLNEAERRQLDALWTELNFITGVPLRQYQDFIFFERAEPPRFMQEAEFDFARSEDKDAASAAKIARLREAYLAKAVRSGAKEPAVEAIKTYFANVSTEIRWLETSRAAAQASHLQALVDFAQRAWRRPLKPAEREELLAFYRTLRDQEQLSHEDALRDALASVLLSPYFCYRFDLAAPGREVRPLDDYELASRLSYFLWSSMPDDELLSHAAAGDLHHPDVLASQTRRLLRDPRVRGLAVEFLGNLLDFRRFEEHNSVDRRRFPTFTGELRQAMFEEPLRYFIDAAQHNRPVLELVEGRHTLVNPVLAEHYGMPVPGGPPDAWTRIDAAAAHGRGGLLPMAVFLTKNSPGLRTSPVKRGYWVVQRLLGERIPPPPPSVPELPKDEADLGELTLAQTLARHRSERSCAACHQRFDSIGLVLEDYGPIGERRTKDLGGRPVENLALFPDQRERQGLDGLRAYILQERRDDFLESFTGKLFSYALGRTLLPSDQPTLRQMQTRLAADGYNLGSLIEAVVASPQFLHKRGRDEP
jgi:mono/diheme cytochrome c family protein